MVKKQCKLKFRPFEILAIKDGVIWASEVELVGALPGRQRSENPGLPVLVRFIYILDSSNSSSFTF